MNESPNQGSEKLFVVNRDQGRRPVGGSRIQTRRLIDEAKASIHIRAAWARLGLPGDPGKSPMHSPFRQDEHPSFGISPCGRFFRDFATEEIGDVVDFIQRAKKCSIHEAISTLLKMAGLEESAVSERWSLSAPSTSSAAQKITQKSAQRAEKPRPRFPVFHQICEDALRQLAALRGLNEDAIRHADEIGILKVCEFKGAPAWVVTDEFALNAQVRRLDGNPWVHNGSTIKCLSLPGSWANWPVGLSTASGCSTIALVEGGPDMLAAAHFIATEYRKGEVRPVGMLGAATSIHDLALPYFKGKVVHIFQHSDPAGYSAASRWQKELEGYAAHVDIRDVSQINPECKDLNDLASKMIAGSVSRVQVLPQTIKE